MESETIKVLDNNHLVISEYYSCPEQQLKLRMEPIWNCSWTPLNYLLWKEIWEKMFAVNSAADSFEEELINDYDKNKIDKFKESIELKINSYFMRLPWFEDKINFAPSNYQVNLKILDKPCFH